jgi:putative membrane protein
MVVAWNWRMRFPTAATGQQLCNKAAPRGVCKMTHSRVYYRVCVVALVEVEMSLIVSWLVLSLAVWVTAAVLPGFHLKGVTGALLVAAIFGLLNFLLGWLFFTVFTVVTLGLAWLLAFITRWIINAILLVITDKLTDQLKIDNFGWALAGALIISIVSSVVGVVLRVAF